MAYCLKADIEARYLGTTFGTADPLTGTEVGDFIDTNDAVIDGRLSLVYETPVTGVKSLKILKVISTLLTVADTDDVLTMRGLQTPESSRSRGYREKAEAMIQQIVDGDLILSDAVVVSQSGSMVRSYNVENNIEPVFHKDVEEW